MQKDNHGVHSTLKCYNGLVPSVETDWELYKIARSRRSLSEIEKQHQSNTCYSKTRTTMLMAHAIAKSHILQACSQPCIEGSLVLSGGMSHRATQ